jgi:hypothetical protein
LSARTSFVVSIYAAAFDGNLRYRISICDVHAGVFGGY